MKKSIKLSAVAVSVVGALLLSTSSVAAPTHDRNVIGYLTQWEAWKGPQHGFSVAGEATHLNVDMDIYSILNYSFFGVAKDGSLHSGDLRNKQIYQPGAVQEPGSLLFTDVYSSWDLHILWGELEYLWSYPGNEAWEAENLAKVKKQGFVKNGSGWMHKPSGITGEMPIPLKKEGGAPGLIDLANEKGVKVMASLGGWSMSKHFPEMAADPVKKARFLKDIDKLMALGFHGIDIDWEYPGTGGMNFSGSESDYANFEQLMEDIRTRIGEDKLITAAFKAVPAALEGFDWDRLTRSMDYFNMMTYDLNGGWSEVTGHNSPLYPYPEEEFAGLTIDTLRDWMINERGIPAEKINFGAAFYGRGVQTTADTAYLGAPTDKRMVNFEVDGPTHSSVDITNWANFEGQPSYNYLTKQSNWDHFWDDNARVPYAVNGKYFLSYDDPQSIREKAQYIVDNDLGGIIVWQVHGDIECKGSFTSFGSKLKQCSELSSPLAEQIDSVFSQNTLPNTAPVLSVPSALNADSGEVIRFSVSATDKDGDTLIFSAQGADLVDGESNSAMFSYQAPSTAKDLSEVITVRVTDGKKSDSETVTVHVKGTGEAVNSAPILNAPTSAEVNAGEVATILISATDADNDRLTFTTSVGTIIQSGNNATLSVPTSASAQDTIVTVTVSVSDTVDSDSASISIKVKGNEEVGDTTWSKDQIYLGGDKVTYHGVEYTAKWWTKGDTPGTSEVWEEKDDGSVKEWKASKAYNGGDVAIYQGTSYKAKWWTKGDVPGTAGAPWSTL